MYWCRVGDAGEYESFDCLDGLGEHLTECGVHLPIYWRVLGMESPGFEGQNYVSVYSGDDVETPCGLDAVERMVLRNNLTT